MYRNIFLNVALSIVIIFYGVFKLKKREHRFARILAFYIAAFYLLIIATRSFLENTVFYPIIVYGGIIIMFALFTVGVWNVRKDPEKKSLVHIYFGGLGFLLLSAIVIYILIRTGFFG